MSRAPGIFTGRDEIRRLDDVEKMMGRTRPFARGRLGRANLEFAIQRDRIAINNFALEMFRENEREGRFAACSRAEKDNQQRVVLLLQRQLQ
jgi:hypothetical protein